MSLEARVYTADGVERFDDVTAAYETPGETWVTATDAETEEVERLRETFGIHQLAIEAVRDATARPRTVPYDGHTFVLVKTARLARGDVAFEKEVRASSIGLFVGPDWLVTVTTEPVPIVDAATERWTADADRVLDRGTDFVAYRIMDAVVDDYFALLDDIESDIEGVEERVLDEAEPEMLAELNAVRRDLLAFRKLAWPTREAVGTLSRGDVPEVGERNEKYFRDVYDHLVQVVDLIETYRDLTAGSRDIYLNTVSQSTNEVMKTLTVVATVFIPPTFVVGVYGMNFSGSPFAMPELGWTYGYPAVMLGMALVAAVMVTHFRRQGWL